ncbi:MULTISPECIES: IclR family transcriptional regulator [Sphingobium]|uniref:IclR family transcriptional regulator n=1 Tax=Sphingobium TaxID=165695 RepID=UPI00035F9ED4|nr:MULTISPECIES: IclR family transcriptional regulator [Sphingobium]MDF0546254.1 IclR family transcriptional regulator [Sphingobium arseniciresistens]
MADKDEGEGSGRRRGIQSIEIGMRIVDALAASEGPLPLSSIAQITDMAAPQVHRYLHSLIAAGTARQDPATGHYDLGPGVLRIGLAALARTDAFRIVDRVIGSYVETSGQTVQISALGPTGPTIVRIYRGRPALLTTLQVGVVLPLAGSATGRVFLAFAPPAETAAAMTYEGSDGMERAALDDMRSSVRREGRSVEPGSLIPGLRATAFPIFDLQGRAILVATVLGLVNDWNPKIAQLVGQLGGLCKQISAELGWLDEGHRSD